jgi:hypothetical protein
VIPWAILDLDGCIADDRRRLPLIDPKAPDPWAAYHAGCYEDPLINEPLLTLCCRYSIAFFTGRPSIWRAHTNGWLQNVVKFRPYLLFMRSPGCLLPSPELKERMLLQLTRHVRSPSLMVRVAADDRDDVLLMYQSYGIEVIKTSYP